MGIMPYHQEKGHYLLLLEETLNEGIEAVVDDDTATTFPGLDRRYSMLEHMRDVVARPCNLTHGESETGGVLAWPEFMDDDAVGFHPALANLALRSSASRNRSSCLPFDGSVWTATCPSAFTRKKPCPHPCML